MSSQKPGKATTDDQQMHGNSMTAEPWQRVKELFAAALQLAPSARKDFLDRECDGNSALRSEVESLLDFASSSTASQPPSPERSTLAAGTRLGEYEVVSFLGSGGFGGVYQARDLRLHRDVAIKILPPAFSADAAALRRFEREALAAAQLNHPHIVTIHAIEHVGDVHLIVMELVEGETLERVIPSTGLGLEKFLQLAAELTDAFSAAHGKGIIHRDLKPANIMVDKRGSIKVLDFGIAKLTALPGSEAQETITGVVSGTVPYMSPEQLQGTKQDTRTDVFSMGGVLYQMITGQRPFYGNAQAALISSILRDKPKSILELRPELPASLQRMLDRCLAKNAAERFNSTELHDAIQRLRQELASDRHSSSSGDVARIRSLAVLPLENLSRDPEQEYFADGLTEALITTLAKIGELRVPSRTSAMLYKGAHKPLREIAQELEVDAVVEGTVLRVGRKVRITAQLIEAADDRHLWAESYERDLRNVLALQAEVVQAIARQIRVTLSPIDEARFSKVGPLDPEAYEAYLKARFHWNKRTAAGLKMGAQYFQEAIEKDATYSAAYAGLADSAGLAGFWGFVRPEDGCLKAKAAARKSLDIEETAEAHASLGWSILHYDYDYLAAEKEFQRAIALNPRYATAHQWYGHSLGYVGRFEDSAASTRRALQLDPLSPIIHASHGGSFWVARDWDQTIEVAKQGLELDPNFPALHWLLANAHQGIGAYEQAICDRQRAFDLSGKAPVFLAELGATYAAAGKKEEARQTLAQLIELSSQRYVMAYWIVLIHTGLKERDEAFHWLEKALEERSAMLSWARVDPRLDFLRSEPRFQNLMHRMNTRFAKKK